jgi:serine/threonine protein kinase
MRCVHQIVRFFSSDRPTHQFTDADSRMAELQIINRRDIEINTNVAAKEGGSGKVEQGFWINRNGQKHVVAVKSPKDRLTLTERDFENFQKESVIMATVTHPHCVMLLAAGDDPKDPMLVMEWMDGDNLMQELGKNHPPPVHARVRMSREIASAVDYLHKGNITHGDLKSLNVMLSQDLAAKICDFGSAVQKLNSKTSTKGRGHGDYGGSTVGWMAPELFEGIAPNKKTDVYAFGIILWELAMCEVPFKDKINDFIVIELIKSGKHLDISDPLPECASNFPPKYFELMKSCWGQPQDRPEMSSLFADLTSIDSTARPAAPLLLFPPNHGMPSGPLYDCIPNHLLANKNKVWQKMAKDAETKSSSAAVVALCRQHGLSPLEAQSLTVSFSFAASDFFVQACCVELTSPFAAVFLGCWKVYPPQRLGNIHIFGFRVLAL